jgi:hypothetical protein
MRPVWTSAPVTSMTFVGTVDERPSDVDGQRIPVDDRGTSGLGRRLRRDNRSHKM